jgi:hypothetical protein
MLGLDVFASKNFSISIDTNEYYSTGGMCICPHRNVFSQILLGDFDALSLNFVVFSKSLNRLGIARFVNVIWRPQLR